MGRAPLAEYHDPFVHIEAVAGRPPNSDDPLDLIIEVSPEGGISDQQLALLRAHDPGFPAAPRLRLAKSSPAVWILDQHGHPLAIAVPESNDAAAAFLSGAKSGQLIEPGSHTLLAATAEMPTERAESFAEGLVFGAHDPKRPVDADPARVLVMVAESDAAQSVRRRMTLTRGVLLARELANTPSNIKTPQWLAGQAEGLAGGGLEVSVLEEDALLRLGMGGVLAVGAGSANPPNVTLLRWRNAERLRPRAVVGKGITFDSGGLSIKPSAGMPLMKTDMAGAAALLGAFASLKELRPQTDVVGIIACAENMPSGSAMRPGDVITHYGGRTTEVLNTDAEGRLVLADCLSYAADQYRPRSIVDLATLTGSATLGLGRSHAPLYCDSPELSRELTAAADFGGEGVWPMPLVDDYRQAIASQVADSANVNTDPHVSAGSITAALFLQPFARGTPWAHLDIAGTGRRESASPGRPSGATGFGVRLLTEWLMDSR